MFDSPSTASAFTTLLISSITKNQATLNWDADVAGREAVCRAAFAHGELACQRTRGEAVNWGMLYATLQEIKAAMCPGGAGGGAHATSDLQRSFNVRAEGTWRATRRTKHSTGTPQMIQVAIAGARVRK